MKYRIGPVRLNCGIMKSEGNSIEDLIKNYSIRSGVLPDNSFEFVKAEVVSYIKEWFGTIHDRSQFDV